MANLIGGYACPICGNVMDEEFCSDHPDTLTDLFLNTVYEVQKDKGDAPWHLVRFDDTWSSATVVCTMSGETTLDAENAGRIGTVLDSCREIPTVALSNGYIQTLQQLPLLISDHLNNPTPSTEERLRKQLALVHSRYRSKELTADDEDCEHDADEEEDDDNDDLEENNFDLNLPVEWHSEVWQAITGLLVGSGFTKEERHVFTKQLDDQRLAIVYLFETYTRTSLKISTNFAICHQTLIEAMQRLTGKEHYLGRKYTELQPDYHQLCKFTDFDHGTAEEFVLATVEYALKLSNDYPSLYSICLGLVESENDDAYATPLAHAFLGNKKAAIAVTNEWIAIWRAHPRNTEGTEEYIKTFVRGLKKIEAIS